MKKNAINLIHSLVISGLVVITSGGSDISYAASTDWQELGGGKARLVARKNPENGTIDGYIEVRLDEGWKTYWKSPGGAGIAPEFDFSGSRGFFIEDVSFPIPEWISLPDTSFYGYKGIVTFPFHGVDEAPDSTVSLNALLGVCKEICIPATARFELESDQLNRSDPRADVTIELARSKLPGPPESNFRFSSLSQDGNILRVTGIANNSGSLKAVISVPGVWISDPKSVTSKSDGDFEIEFSIPDLVSKYWDHMSKQVPAVKALNYTLLEHGGENGNVTRAVSGMIDVEQQAN